MWGRGKGAASSQRRRAPDAVGWDRSSSPAPGWSSPHARLRPSPPASSRPRRGSEPRPRPKLSSSEPELDSTASASSPGTGVRVQRVSDGGATARSARLTRAAVTLTRCLAGEKGSAAAGPAGRRAACGGTRAGSSRRGGARLLKAAGLPPPPPSWRARLRVHAAARRHRRRLARAWARSRRHHRRQGRRDRGRTESVSFQHLARARATRERAGSAACGWCHVDTIVVPPSKGCAAAESGGHACGAAHGSAGGRPAVASGGARLAFRSLGSALPSVCSSCSASAGETTTVVHLCATRGSRCLARVATGTHWALRIHLTHDCQPGSAATGARRGSGEVRLPKTGRNLASPLHRGRQPFGC